MTHSIRVEKNPRSFDVSHVVAGTSPVARLVASEPKAEARPAPDFASAVASAASNVGLAYREMFPGAPVANSGPRLSHGSAKSGYQPVEPMSQLVPLKTE